MAVDSSDVAIGACLFQNVDGVEHPICHLSKKLNKHLVTPLWRKRRSGYYLRHVR